MTEQPLLFFINDFLFCDSWFLVNTDILTQSAITACPIFTLELLLSFSFKLFHTLVEYFFVHLSFLRGDRIVNVPTK